MYKQNLHTHSTYCDGKNSPRDVIEIAIKKGFDSIGFSGHSYTFYAPDYCMSQQQTEDYFNEVNRLKKEFEEKCKIFCGIEYDMYSDFDISRYDYSIGSLHYLKIGKEYVGFDRPCEVVENIINTYFDGDGMKFAKKYYQELATLPEYGKFDIIGHFDVLAKHIEKINMFDENSKEYLSYAAEAAEALKGKIPFFEVNSGAISRGYRTTPYPSIPILKELKRLGFGAVITSDCHNAEYLDCYFNESAELLKECGFKNRFVLTYKGFEEIEL